MTHLEIKNELGRLVLEERKITNQILEIINLAYEKRSYLEFGFPSLYEWLVKGFGYSNAAAYRRIEAAKLIRSVPLAQEKLEAGQVNLSTLSKAQSMIKAQEKISGVRISNQEKSEIVSKIESKSTEQTEQILVSLFPELSSKVHQTHKTVIDETTTRYSINFSKEMMEDLIRAKEVLSHKIPNESDAEVLAHVLQFFLKEKDPLALAPEAKRVKNVKQEVLKTSNATCQYRDSQTGQVCGTRYQVQVDHVMPKALGGSNAIENLRPLCRSHNLLMAERTFGKPHMDRFRKRE